MFEFFPGNHAWSSTVNLALMAGGSIGDMHRWLGPLRDAPAAAQVSRSAALSLIHI